MILNQFTQQLLIRSSRLFSTPAVGSVDQCIDALAALQQKDGRQLKDYPVSYTHLTLPTIA